MASFNTGAPVLNVLTEDKSTQEQMATDFSEGSNALRDLLLFLWKNGVSTHACCRGGVQHIGGPHEENGITVIADTNPYLVFDTESIAPELLKYMLIYFTQNGDFLISVENDPGRDVPKRMDIRSTVSFNFCSDQISQIMIKKMQTIFKRAISDYKFSKIIPRDVSKHLKKGLSQNQRDFINASIMLTQLDLTNPEQVEINNTSVLIGGTSATYRKNNSSGEDFFEPEIMKAGQEANRFAELSNDLKYNTINLLYQRQMKAEKEI